MDVIALQQAKAQLRRGLINMRQRGIVASLPLSYTVMATPPTYARGVANAATSITSGVQFSAADKGAFAYRMPPSAFGFDFVGMARCNPSNQLIGSTPPWAVEWVSDAPKIEIMLGGNLTPRYRLVVDQYDGAGPRLVSGTPYLDPGDTNGYRDLFDWTSAGGRRVRHYRLECEPTFRFAGVEVGPQDFVNRSPHEELTLLVGDSFVEPTIQETTFAATQFTGDGLGSVFGRGLGLRNCIPSGSGGTGYLNPGPGAPRVKFRDRFMQDIAANHPARLFFMGGLNDANREPTYTAQMVHDECVTLFDLAKQQLPYSEIGVFSPWCGGGTISNSLWAVADAIQAAATSCGLRYYDVLGIAPAIARSTVHLTATTTASTTITTDGDIAPGSWVRVGYNAGGWGATPSTQAVVQTSGHSGTGPYTINLSSGITAGIPSGAAVVTTGRPWITGNGKQTAQNNSGSADWLLGGDSTHPTMEGHLVAGRAALQAYLSTLGF